MKPGEAQEVMSPIVAERRARALALERFSRHARHDERDAPPVRGRPAGVSRSVQQDHVTLAPAGLPVGLGAMGRGSMLRLGRQMFPTSGERSRRVPHPLLHWRIAFPIRDRIQEFDGIGQESQCGSFRRPSGEPAAPTQWVRSGVA